MRILIATGIFKPEVGGPATFATEIGIRLQAAGHKVTVVTYSDKPAYDFDAGYRFRLIRIVRSNKLFNYMKYFFAVLREAPRHDFIFALDWFSAGMPVLLASLITRKRYVIRVGGGYIWEKYLSEGKPPVTLREFYARGMHREYRVMFFIIATILRHAKAVIFNSTIQRELYHKYYGLDPEKTFTIFNATPEYRFASLVKTYKTIQEDRDKEIVFAGRFIKMKNVESLVRAFAKLGDYSYKLLLIGSGPTEAELRKLVDELGVSHRVTFMPSMPLADLYRRIANCAYVVTPSWTDVSPHQVYECLALGIPFLLTEENYLSINSHNFLKIDPKSVDDIAEKMNWLLDKNNYEQFAESLSKIEFKHTWDDVIVEHMRLFRELTGKK